ncbi:MAG: twin-arginine translocase subunit TatC [Rhodospirillales bacterium]
MQDDKHGPQDPESVHTPEEDPYTEYPREDPYTGYPEDPYANYEETPAPDPPATAVAAPVPPAEKAAPPAVQTGNGGGSGKPPASSGGDSEDDEEEGMLRMSFVEHLEELRARILKALAGVGIAFALCLIFANDLWVAVSDPAVSALRTLGFQEKLVFITPMEAFMILWVKLPMLAAIFVASPWILYQAWAFIAPGLYKRERRWAAPFIICSAGLFILGGVFGYFVAFRYGLTFLLGIGRDIHVQPMVSVTEYFNLFVNVMLGIGVTFELPILIFFLTLLRITTPGFLLRNSRYAILAIVVLAALITPTPDVFNLMIFSVPMALLFFVGIFAGYLLTLHRENRKFPWKKVLLWLAPLLVLLAAAGYYLLTRYGFHFLPHWPFISK